MSSTGLIEERDMLTGLPKRGPIMEILRHTLEASYSGQGKNPVSVMLVDVYRLKRHHDLYGHSAVDDVLKQVGNVIQAQTGIEDMACRYGGDEFLLVMFETPLEAAQKRAEQLKKAASGIKVRCGGQSREHIVLSVGVAEHFCSPFRHPVNEETKLWGAEALMQAVDDDLRRDRQLNENRESITT